MINVGTIFYLCTTIFFINSIIGIYVAKQLIDKVSPLLYSFLLYTITMSLYFIIVTCSCHFIHFEHNIIQILSKTTISIFIGGLYFLLLLNNNYIFSKNLTNQK